MKQYISILVGIASFFTSCSEDAPSPILKEETKTFTTTSDVWTYISLETGHTVASCLISDTITQKEMAIRSGWDIALCNGMIRTNSGKSGNANGGIITVDDAYDVISTPQVVSYQVDEKNVDVWN